MGQLVLEGDTLGKRHRHYNELLKQTITKEKQSGTEKITDDNNDVENLLKIDVASHNRDIEYMLETFKSEDSLYVSKAIKRSTWIVTDPQHAHIINPIYLHSQLFPHMTAKAVNKLMLHIRLHLKDEKRVNEFYYYLKEKDPKSALKWLPYSSLEVIEKEVENYHLRIKINIIKRLCERSITVLEKYIKTCEYYKKDVLEATMFVINSSPEKYLDIVDTLEHYQIPNFRKKSTTIIMKRCPERFIDNFEKYCRKINLEIFAKHLKDKDIKGFLLKHFEKESMKSWFRYENLQYFIKYMPKEGRFDFLKKVFIEKREITHSGVGDSGGLESGVKYLCSPVAYSSNALPSSTNIYRWYRFAPFEEAFLELKKLSRAESSPVERNAILSVLLSCAGRNTQNIQAVLQYYHDKHINEPFKFKIQFVNKLLSQASTHSFDDKTWGVLNNIFYSMEIYSESENNVQLCIQSIIMYKILHYENIPEVIEKKFIFDTFKSHQNKLNEEEKEKLFNYLYNNLLSKIKIVIIQNDSDFTEVLELLEKTMKLLMDWQKELLDHPWINDKIKELVNLKKERSYKADLLCLYNINKKWRKHMFEESILINLSEDACLNALKHSPELLTRHKDEVEMLCRNENVALERVLAKMRIYWPDSLANEWTTAYLEKIDSSSANRAIIRGLCILMPQKRLVDILKKYAPTETKINWSEENEQLLGLRKQIAKNVHLARPLLSPDLVLLYAHGDYLQYVLPSLNSILFNMSSTRIRENIPKLLEAPVSLKKHGIRLAFSKLSTKELKPIFTDIWKTSKNTTIRAVLFRQTYKLLCREKKPCVIEEIWELLNTFIDNLSTEENRIIYNTLSQVDDVPLLVRGKFCMKGYKYLKSLPAKSNCETILTDIANYSRLIMEHLDGDFVAEVLLESADKKFTTKDYYTVSLLAPYLLCAKDSQSQSNRYQKVMTPIWNRALPLWDEKIDGCYIVRKNVRSLLKELSEAFPFYSFEKQMVFPVEMFIDISNKLEESLPFDANYVLLRSWRLTIDYVKQLSEHRALIPIIRDPTSSDVITSYQPEDQKKWNVIYSKAAPRFAAYCVEYLKKEITSYFPSIYLLFGQALDNMFKNIQVDRIVYLETLKSMLYCKEIIEVYLMVLRMLPENFYADEESKNLNEIRKIFLQHPAEEVKMHYYLKFQNTLCDTDDFCC